MSQENVEIFKRAVELWNRDDLDAWIDLFDREFEWHTAIERAVEGSDSVFAGFPELGRFGRATRAKRSSGWKFGMTTFETSANPFLPLARSRSSDGRASWSSPARSRSWSRFAAARWSVPATS